eukprot:Em0004g1003a
MVDPRSLYTCDHHFCRKCLSPSNVSRCPTCNVPAWTKDLKSNQQINNIVHLTATLRNYISAAEPADIGPELCPSNVAHCEAQRDDVAVKEATPIRQCGVMVSSWKRNQPLDCSAASRVCINKKETSHLKQQFCVRSEGENKLRVTQNPSTLAKVRKRNMKGETPLHLAAMKGDAAAVVALVEQGADCHAKDNAGWTPLHEACNFGHMEVVKILLDNGVSVNTPGFENSVPLHDAVINNHVQVVELLISSGANPNARNSNGLTPLDLASTEAIRNALTSPVTRTLPPPLSAKASSKVVMLVTGLGRDEKVQLQELAKLLQGEVATTFSPRVSHVIAPCNSQRCCARTLKSLSGVAMGKWVLSFDWVKESLKARCHQEESSYEIQGFVLQDISTITNAPQISRENARMQKPGLFAGCSFYLHGSFVPPSLSKDDIASLVAYAGGIVLRKLPRTISADDSLLVCPLHAQPGSVFEKCHVFIVYDPTSTTNLGDVPTVAGVTNIVATWILDCLSSFKLLELPV